MKIVFVLIVLANIFVALWEYRYGQAFAPSKLDSSLEQNTPGLEKIFLINETNQHPTSKTSESDQNTRQGNPSTSNPDNKIIQAD